MSADDNFNDRGTPADADGAHANPGPTAPDLRSDARLLFPVVGIGTSAGGIEALTAFFSAIPADTGMAYVVIQHLAPDRESMMPQIIARHTKMPVRQIEDGMQVEPDHVYVIRPGHTVTLERGRLRTGADVRARGHRRPVDDFFRSLAEQQRERAVAVVLSGMGSNCTAGAQAIKAGGGICIAQDPDSAGHAGMPSSLIGAGYADLVQEVADIALTLAKYAKAPYLEAAAHPREWEDLLGDDRHLNETRAILRVRTSHDFSGYKRATVLRRVLRRMSLRQVPTLERYCSLLRSDPEEAPALTNDLLISVTGFFRDPEAWEALRELVIVPLVASRQSGQSIRAWSAACASGEEPYSLAMLLLEEAERAGKHFEIKIFATDAAPRSLDLARAGHYPGGIEGDVPFERLERFFDATESGYRVKGELREAVVFAPHNVLRDAPFSRLDICLCRNLLIYLEPDTQRRLLTGLIYGVREGGCLFLGSSETPGMQEGRVETLNKNWRIFRKVGGAESRLSSVFPYIEPAPRLSFQAAPEPLPRPSQTSGFPRHEMLNNESLPGVVVDRREQLVYVHGEVSRYLHYPAGEPTLQLFDIVKPVLRPTVRRLLRAAMGAPEAGQDEHNVVELPESRGKVSIRVRPLVPGTDYFFISFAWELVPLAVAGAGAGAGAAEPDGEHSSAMARANEMALEEEVRSLRQELQNVTEAFQIGHEEQKASNEELTSINEELQSSNEELESTQEELQSLNEELTTVNGELQAKVTEIEAINNDLANLLSNTAIAVVFLDSQFRVRRYTPAITEIVNLNPADIGRPMRHLTAKFPVGDLHAEAAEVLTKLVSREEEVRSDAGRWYLKRILPYRTSEHGVDGVVITFVETTSVKNAERQLEAAHKLRRAVLDQMPEAVLIAEPGGRLIYGNRSAASLFGLSSFPTSEMDWRAVQNSVRGFHADGRPYAPEEWPIYRAVTLGETVAVEEIEYIRPDGGRGRVSANAAPVRGDAGEILSAVCTFTEITERTLYSRNLLESEARFRVLVESAVDTAIFSMDADGRIRTWNKGAEQVTGWSEREIIGQGAEVLFTPEDRSAGQHLRELSDARETGKAMDERWHVRKDGTHFWASGVLTSVQGSGDKSAFGYLKVMRDATSTREAEQRLRTANVVAEESRLVAERANSAKDDFVAVVSHELRSPLNTISLWAQILDKDKPTGAALDEGLQAILRSSRRQQQLIDDLLDVARMGSGKLRVSMRPTRLTDVVEAALESIRPAAQARGVALEQRLGQDVGVVRADPDRLEQVVLNLLNNAVKFTPSGGTVTIAMRREADTVVMEVADTGIGIKPEFIARIFSPFSQAEVGAARAHSGLGLGLAISKQLVEQHNGSITVHSDGPGRGAVFTVRLPFATPVEDDPGVKAGEQARPRNLTGLNVLLVEDDTESARAITGLLTRHGVQVTAVESAAAARQAISLHPPRVIVSDIGLPGEDGYMFISSVRSAEQARGDKRVLAIALTAFAGMHDRSRALEAGFDFHLSKPVDSDSLLTLLGFAVHRDD
jgi:two-component system CheB/CheR fusion protein